jgi:UDP-N-acetylmuramoyl-L-alanyl-D-glutamate--2,6-diaminopimelate ligase
VQQRLAEFVSDGLQAVVMEVSSHGLAQARVGAVPFEVAVLTNLSRDHLDYHGDMVAYANAKRQLFRWDGLQAAVVNLDDSFGRELLSSMPGETFCLGYTLMGTDHVAYSGRKPDAILSAGSVQQQVGGLSFTLSGDYGEASIETRLLGRFNVANTLAAVGAALVQGAEFRQIVENLKDLRPVAGRLETIGGPPNHPLIVVDYAHTPDGLEQALTALRTICPGALWCVFGCGGNRDKGKRPLMGAVAERLADRVLLTSDNPRDEAPEAILRDIAAGLRRPADVSMEPDRAQAIREVIASASVDDIVLIAGKGHEDYQEIAGKRLFFRDQDVVRAALGNCAK